MSNIIKQIDRLDFTDEQKKIIRDTYANGATEAELAPLLEIAAQRRLNPFMRQVWFVKRWDNGKKCYVWSIQVAIDGLRAIAERTGKYAGQSEPEYCYQDSDDPDSVLKWCKVRVYREGWREPVTGWAFYNEFVQKTNEGKVTAFWQRMPHIMLAKCAEALALRKAFPEDMSGLYIPEEMGAGAVQSGEFIQEEEPKQLSSPPVRLPVTPVQTPAETMDSKTSKAATQAIAPPVFDTIAAEIVTLNKPTLDAIVQLWIDRDIEDLGTENAASMFSIALGSLPKRTPKAWINDGIAMQRILDKQEPEPDIKGDSYEPNERARFNAWVDCLESVDSIDAIASAWIARKDGSSESTRAYWWHCACVTLAWSEGLDSIVAESKLRDAVKAKMPPDPNTPKKRGRKAPVSTPANGQGHETTQQIGTTGRTEHAPVATAEGWRAHLLAKKTPYACATSWAKWRHRYQHISALCRAATIDRMVALGASEEIVVGNITKLVPIPAQLDGIIAKYEQDKLDREHTHSTVRKAA